MKVVQILHLVSLDILKLFEWCQNNFFCGTEVWSQGLHLKPLHQSFFEMGFLKIGSRELFAQAGFELDPPDLLPPE
jgi:hypothetical protein